MQQANFPLYGSCLCGVIQYQVDRLLPLHANCHCKMCRKFHGAAFSTFAGAKLSDLHWLQGKHKLKSYKADNGSVRQFCADCGSSLTFTAKADLGTNVEFALASLDSPSPVKPDANIFLDDKADWYEVTDSLPAYSQDRQSAPYQHNNAIQFFQVDAFTSDRFKGNPAAVCPLNQWLDVEVMQRIAAENNLSETAFFIPTDKPDSFQLRWFTPTTEVELCGHATLATAWVLFNEIGVSCPTLTFKTRSGDLSVENTEFGLSMNFPCQQPQHCGIPAQLLSGLGVNGAVEVLAAEDYLVVLNNEAEVTDLQPDFTQLKNLPLRGVIVTAPGDSADFVSRWFGPNVGVNEDPVTGSAHTTLTPYWAKRLEKTRLRARQISQRGGELVCEIKQNRVILSGHAVKTLQGHLYCS